MSIWDYVFDSDRRQRRDIERLKDSVAARTEESYRQCEDSNRHLSDLRCELRGMRKELAEQHLLNRAILQQLRRLDKWNEEEFQETLRKEDPARIDEIDIPCDLDMDLPAEGIE